jgi:transposase
LNITEEIKGTNNKLYFLDPMHQIHNNVNGYAWQPIGAKGTKQVKSNTGRRRLNIIGALDPLALEPIIILTEANCNAELMVSYLAHVKDQNPGPRTIYIVLDNAGYNRAHDVKNTAEELGIKLIYLPPYCPNLNLIERLWKYFKKKVMKNKYYQDFDDFYESIALFFKNIMNNLDELKSLLTLNFGIIKTD